MENRDDEKLCSYESVSEKLHYFQDGERRVDFVLAYYASDTDKNKKVYFDNYLDSLKSDGLQIEQAESNGKTVKDQDKGHHVEVHFYLIHAPMDVLYTTAEDLKMKMPTKPNDIDIKHWYEHMPGWKSLNKINPFRVKQKEATNYFVATFDKHRLAEFIYHDQPDKFFTSAERGRLVYNVLQRAKYGEQDTQIGIENLVHMGVFADAYPLHDGPTLQHISDTPSNERQRLQKDWASMRCLFKYQPIYGIREYFGEKIALYFAWLGLYTTFLVPASIVGIICFIYGVVTSLDSPVVTQACSDPRGADGTHRFYMCPLCDKMCSYFLLSSHCMYAKATHWFDNEGTLFFAIFMSIWATLFLEFWKRNEVSLAYEWHSIGFEDLEEQVRPEYSASSPVLKENPVTLRKEPHMPARMRWRRLLGTMGVVSFFVLLVLAAVVGVIIFRASLSVALLASSNPHVRAKSKTIVAVVAGCVNLVAINILKVFYNKVAVLLTDWQNPRTRTEYEDSYTIKMFFFQFVNTYSSIIYIAFFKTEAITGSPGNYKRFGQSHFRLDGCSAQGCFLELTIQLFIIMVGQQFVGAILETVLPALRKWWHRKRDTSSEQTQGYNEIVAPQWLDDFEGEMQTKFSLFWEYLEIVLQYGFVTMFVSGLPLAPLFALVNNLFEIRIDAINYVNNFRRPVAQRAEDIGAWYGILASLTSFSVLINAFVLAFTSELIPRLVYKYHISIDRSLTGYVDWSLSSFNVADFANETRPWNATSSGIPEQSWCRYAGYHVSTYPYARSIDYWLVMTVRLAFVLCFVLFVLFVSWAIAYMIPDVPESLDLKVKREKWLANEADKEHRAKQGAVKKEQ